MITKFAIAKLSLDNNKPVEDYKKCYWGRETQKNWRLDEKKSYFFLIYMSSDEEIKQTLHQNVAILLFLVVRQNHRLSENKSKSKI
jgi:hypothetical protein